jgi:hypothetical protein
MRIREARVAHSVESVVRKVSQAIDANRCLNLASAKNAGAETIRESLGDVFHYLEKLFDMLKPQFLFARILILPKHA